MNMSIRTMTLMKGRQALRSGEVSSPAGVAVAARRLRVVSRNPLLPGVFIAGLSVLMN
jgi:hypothetical protein